MAVFTVNGADFPAPTTLSVSLEDAGAFVRRALSGTAHISRAALKRRIEAYWAYLAPESLQLLLLAAAQNANCTISYPDPLTGDLQSLQVYAAARRMDLTRMREGTPVWTGIKITFAEC